MRYRDLPEQEKWAAAVELDRRYHARAEETGQPVGEEEQLQMARDHLREMGYSDED